MDYNDMTILLARLEYNQGYGTLSFHPLIPSWDIYRAVQARYKNVKRWKEFKERLCIVGGCTERRVYRGVKVQGSSMPGFCFTLDPGYAYTDEFMLNRSNI